MYLYVIKLMKKAKFLGKVVIPEFHVWFRSLLSVVVDSNMNIIFECKFIRSLTSEDTHIGGYYDYDQKVWNWSDGSLWNYTNWVDSPGGNQFLQIVEEYEGWSKDGEWTTIKEISSTSWKRYWRGSVCQYYWWLIRCVY